MLLLNRMIVYSIIPILAFLSGACDSTTNSLPDLELYPTWNAVGLEITYPDGWNFEKTGSFEWRQNGEDWRPGIELTVFKDENRAYF